MERWCRARNRPIGGVLSLDQAWRLALAWYADHLAVTWRRRTPDEAQAVLARVGLTGDFWQLEG